jgi:hypothetical protein
MPSSDSPQVVHETLQMTIDQAFKERCTWHKVSISCTVSPHPHKVTYNSKYLRYYLPLWPFLTCQPPFCLGGTTSPEANTLCGGTTSHLRLATRTSLVKSSCWLHHASIRIQQWYMRAALNQCFLPGWRVAFSKTQFQLLKLS